MALKITVRLNPWGATAALDGDLDMATEAPAGAALDAVLTAVAARRTRSPGPVGPVGLVLDVSRVFADVRGLTVLHLLWRAGERRAVAVALSGAGPLLHRMVKLLTSPGVPLYPDVAEAWNAVLTTSERVERVVVGGRADGASPRPPASRGRTHGDRKGAPGRQPDPAAPPRPRAGRAR